MPILRLITTITILALLSSCSGSRGVKASQNTNGSPELIYNKALSKGNAKAKISTLPGADRSDLPYIPVITPAEILRVWIYDHISPADDMVVGHWIFLKLRNERWYIEDVSSNTGNGSHAKIPLPPTALTPPPQGNP